MELTTYPLNDKDYDAADAELFHCTRTSGIFDGDDFACSVTGADNNVTVGIGIGWIRNSRFSGKVIALKNALTLDIGVADDTYPRIDAVLLQFDANANGTKLIVKKGTASEKPSPPEVVRNESIYELHLYHVYREAGASSVAVGNLTDLRMNRTYCGLMQDDVTPNGNNYDDTYLKLEGGAMTGALTMKGIILTEGVDFGPTPPENPKVGQLFFIPVSEAVNL